MILIQIKWVDILPAYLHISMEMSSVKENSIKNRTYYFFNDKTNIKNFDPNNIKTDGKLCQNILIYYTGYVKQNKVKTLHLIINKAKEYIDKSNGNEYLTVVPTDKSRDKLKEYEKMWRNIKDLIRLINNNLDDYDEKYENQIQFRCFTSEENTSIV